MTVKECYEQLGGDYDDVVARIGSESLVARIMVKFLNDKSMEQLREATEANDIEQTFMAAHTLKGVAGNMSFSELAKAASDLTEQLRPRKELPDAELLKALEEKYERVIQALNTYKQS